VSTAKTGYYYTTKRKRGKAKLELKKYCKFDKKRTLHKEIK
jgi:ribosomal protein L33